MSAMLGFTRWSVLFGLFRPICVHTVDIYSALAMSVSLRHHPSNTLAKIANYEARSCVCLDLFAKLRKATVSFAMSARLSVCHICSGTSQLPLDGFS
jgi:hypothetical protein